MQNTLLAVLGLSATVLGSKLPVPGEIITGATAADEFKTKSLFDEFTSKYNKNYSAQEASERYTIFRNNLVRIASLNERNGDDKNVFGITPFTDLTAQEFAATKLGFKPTPKFQESRASVPSLIPQVTFANTTQIDWRDKNAVTDVKDQGQCGSCWAFSATEQIETAVFLNGGALPVLSPQQIVSCDKVDLGCNGGDTPTAYEYVEKNGLETEANYPYTSGDSGATGSCKYSAAKATTKINGYLYATPTCANSDNCDDQDEGTFAANVAAKGPASICVNAEAWQFYSSGVMTGSSCGGYEYTDLDHCVQLVGYDLTKTSQKKPYWIVRNSWGTSWGNDGYIYVEYGTNACGVADEATFVTI